MDAKKQMVVLVANGKEREFEISHAERLLKMQNNGGWKIPEDSQFKFDKNGIGIKQDSKRSKDTDKKDGDQSGNTTSAKN